MCVHLKIHTVKALKCIAKSVQKYEEEMFHVKSLQIQNNSKITLEQLPQEFVLAETVDGFKKGIGDFLE